MKIVAAAALVLVFGLSTAAASGATRSGLRGVVMLDPGYPVCKVGVPCTRPASHVVLAFSRRGRVVARTRTSDDGTYRVRLAPGRYRVTSPNEVADQGLTPRLVVVHRGTYRRVNFRLDIGIR